MWEQDASIRWLNPGQGRILCIIEIYRRARYDPQELVGFRLHITLDEGTLDQGGPRGCGEHIWLHHSRLSLDLATAFKSTSWFAMPLRSLSLTGSNFKIIGSI
ncbi:hypothetical protein Tco_0858614 [Tanacetum coccineum]|uniref:Uncharacterized protein n=1 Tax=Tanacetum coccineum TaxID=301880 RepID=A0ABQ5BCK9_9ASTR